MSMQKLMVGVGGGLDRIVDYLDIVGDETFTTRSS